MLSKAGTTAETFGKDFGDTMLDATPLIGGSWGGYYDETGNWQQMKHCFMSCGANCDCQPPGGLYYSAAHDKRRAQAQPHPETQVPGHDRR
jgi:hypothetical protein